MESCSVRPTCIEHEYEYRRRLSASTRVPVRDFVIPFGLKSETSNFSFGELSTSSAGRRCSQWCQALAQPFKFPHIRRALFVRDCVVMIRPGDDESPQWPSILLRQFILKSRRNESITGARNQETGNRSLRRIPHSIDLAGDPRGNAACQTQVPPIVFPPPTNQLMHRRRIPQIESIHRKSRRQIQCREASQTVSNHQQRTRVLFPNECVSGCGDDRNMDHARPPAAPSIAGRVDRINRSVAARPTFGRMRAQAFGPATRSREFENNERPSRRLRGCLVQRPHFEGTTGTGDDIPRSILDGDRIGGWFQYHPINDPIDPCLDARAQR